MMHFLLALSIAGLFTSTMYALLVVVGALRLAQRRQAADAGVFTPPVSLLKPLHGWEPDLESHLESFFKQDYPEFEIIFCARDDRDPGLETARRVAARYPEIRSTFRLSGPAPYANAKVWSLECMEGRAPFFRGQRQRCFCLQGLSAGGHGALCRSTGWFGDLPLSWGRQQFLVHAGSRWDVG
jgi:ceramide glucosyltransferase